MKQLLTTVLSALLLLTFSCHNQNRNEPAKQVKIEPEETKKLALGQQDFVNPEAILKDFKTWWHYTYNNIHLGQNFIGLDADSAAINKAHFLTLLKTGNFVPFKIKQQDNTAVYKLFRLPPSNPDIQNTIKQLAATEMKYFKMEGTELPDYNFVDLNGKKYNKASTKGNILLLKCWFIKCATCVAEFPELNKLVDKYRGKNDLLFISLASDAKKNLVSFLQKKEFKYAVVPNQSKYMSEELGITGYPTHILVDKQGKIVKVGSIDDIIPFLETEIGKTIL